MATTNKDFKIKQGLVVEGATGTINGENILTEGAGDAYILTLIGGETLVTSVNPDQLEVVGGELSVKTGVFDADGSADTAELNAKNYADGLASNYDPAGSAFDAQQNAEGYTDAQLTNYTKTSDLDTTIDGYGYLKSADLTGYATETYADNAATAAENNAKAYADELINDASNASDEVWSAYKTNTEIGLAQSAAESYADTAIANLVDSAPSTLDTLNELAAALQDNPDIITDLQDIAAGKQDTLTAGSNIDITGATISVTGLDTADVAEDASNLYFTDSRAVSAVTGLNNPTYYTLSEKDGKAGVEKSAVASTLGTESINGSGIKVSDTNTGALAIDRTTVDTWYDASGTAQGIVDALDTDDIEEGVNNLYYTDARAKSSATDLLVNAATTNISITEGPGGLIIEAENGVADSTTDDLTEGEENLYFTDERAIDAVSAADIYPNAVIINNLTKQVANQTTVATAGIATGISWAKADYRSAEFVVKVAYGDHTEISKVLMTLDVNDNIAITEYGNVTTNGSASSISADISGTDARLRVTTVNNNSTVTVLGTLIA